MNPLTKSKATGYAKPMVLVIDDEPLLLSSMMRGLSKLESAHFISATNVADARAKIQQTPPQLVISDLDLPDGSGLDILHTLNQLQHHIPIIFMSGYAQNYLSSIPHHPNIQLFEKPFSLRELRATVKQLLETESPPTCASFTLHDYIQLARTSFASVLISIEQDQVMLGQVCIYNGELWSAEDQTGRGIEAIERLLSLENINCASYSIQTPPDRCEFESVWPDQLPKKSTHTPYPSAAAGPLSLDSSGSWSAIPTKSPHPRMHTPLSMPRLDFQRPRAETPLYMPQLNAPPPQEKTPEEWMFEHLLEAGINAMQEGQIQAAYDAFQEADSIIPGDPRVERQLQKLQDQGDDPQTR